MRTKTKPKKERKIWKNEKPKKELPGMLAYLTKGKNMVYKEMYWCAICHKEIVGDDIEDRHSTQDGEDCHENCCPECKNESYD